MNCLWEDIPNSADERGWRKVRCLRPGCGRQSGHTPHEHAKIHATCKALPLKHEIGHWLSLYLQVIGITEARYVYVKQLLGLQAQCGCDQRAKQLNGLGASLLQRVARLRLAFAARISRFPGHVKPQLLTPDFDAARGSNAESAASLTDLNDLDADIVSDDDTLALLALKHEHDDSP